MSAVELSIQLQIQDIAAVQKAYAVLAVVGRDPKTLWWLVDSASNIIYENRVKGATVSAIDDNITNIQIGSSIFGDWFNLQNSYFTQDQPISGVQNLKRAIETTYRWRVPQYFNDVARSNGAGVSPAYVFPYPDFNVGVYEVGGTPAYTKGAGPVDLSVAGPGILKVRAFGDPIGGGAALTLELITVYPDGSSGTLPAIVPAGSEATVEIPVGEVAVSSVAAGGLITVSSATNFKVGPLNLVVIREDKTGTTPFLYLSEVAEVVAIAGNQLTLRQPTPPGAAAPFPNGLRNTYTNAAKVFPLFTDVNGVTASTGTTGDKVQIGFFPDWPQGFVDVTSLSSPQ